MQAVGDGGQGWGNALIYIFLSPTIRKQLFIYPLVRLLFYISKKTKARSERGGQHPVAVQDPPIRRHCSNRDHTHGVRASLAQSGEYAGRVDGKDSCVVDAEMSSLTTDH